MVSDKNQLLRCATQSASGKRLLQLTRSIAAISLIPCTHHDQELIDAPNSSDMMNAEFIPGSLLSLTRCASEFPAQIKNFFKGKSAGAITSLSPSGIFYNGRDQLLRLFQWINDKRSTLDWSKVKSTLAWSKGKSTLDWSKGKSIKPSNVNLQNVQTSTPTSVSSTPIPSYVSSTPSLATAAKALLERPKDLMKEVTHLIFKEDVMIFNKCLKSQWNLRLKFLTMDERNKLDGMVKESEKYTEFVTRAKKRWEAVQAFITANQS